MTNLIGRFTTPLVTVNRFSLKLGARMLGDLKASSRARHVAAAAVALIASGCGADTGDTDQGDDETEEAAQQLTSIGPNNLVTASPASLQGNETSGVSLPYGNSQHVFVSYNSQPSTPRPDGSYSRCGWAYSTNAGGSWTSKEDWSPNLLPGWGTVGGNFSYDHCRGDTYSAAVALEPPTGGGTDRRVAMVAVGFNKKGNDTNTDTGMWTSSDGGVTFPNVTRVSDGAGTGSAGIPNTGSDGPKIAADPTNQAVYVFWWNGDGATIKNWIRKYTIGTQGQITAAGPAIDITQMLANAPTATQHPSIAIKPAAAVNQQPTIYLAYPSSHPTAPDCTDGTGNPPVNSAKASIIWYLSYSTNGGTSWTNKTVDRDLSWPKCLSKTPLGYNKSYISVTYDKTNDAVMLSYSRHMDDAAGSYVGTRVVTRRFLASAFNGYWIPICNPAVCPIGTTNCLVNGAPPVGEIFCHQYGQAVAVRTGTADYRYTSVFHATKDSGSIGYPHPAVGDTLTVNPLASDIWGYSGKTGGAVVPWYTMGRITPLAANVPWLETSTTGHPWWGDYEAAAINLNTKFYAIWGDNRDGTSSTKLRGAYFNE